MTKQETIKLTVRGTRGSCAAPFADRLDYGGNTACVTLQAGRVWVICDAGTGIIPVAEELKLAARQPGTDPSELQVHIFLSHLHLDHVCGLPMFLPGLPKEMAIHVWGMSSAQFCRDGRFRSFTDTLQSVVRPPFWPVTLEELRPNLVFHDLLPQETVSFAPDMTVTTFPANHPDGAANFRLSLQGRSVFYGLDCEIDPDFRAQYISAAKDADVLLFDGTYADEDYTRCRGFGHTSMSQAEAILRETNAGELLILHYDYRYTDTFLQEQEKLLQTAGTPVRFAREGMTLDL